MLSGLPKRTELQECLTTLKRVRNIHNMLSGSLYAIDPLRSCHPSTSSSRIQIFQTESNVVIWRLLDIWILKMAVVCLNDWFGEKERLFIFLEEAWDNCVILDSILLMHKHNPSVIKPIFTNWTSSFLFSPTPLFLSVLHVLCGLKREGKRRRSKQKKRIYNTTQT